MTTKNTARLAGLFYLLAAIAGGFGYSYVQRVLVRWDPAATAANILASETLFRAAIVSNLVSQVLLFFFGLTLFRLLKEVHKAWATVFLTSILMCVTIAVMNTMNSWGALWVLTGAGYLKGFSTEQLNSMALTFLRLNGVGQALLEIFWTPYYFALGLIAIKYRFIPKILGVLFILMGIAVWLNILDKFLVPTFHPVFFTRLVMGLGAVGGISTMLWLLIKGAHVESRAEGKS